MSGRLKAKVARAAESGAVVWLIVLVLALFASIQSSGFGTFANLSNVSRQGSLLAIVALGVFVVVLLGHYDVSIAANAKVSSICAALTMNGLDANLAVGVAVGLGVGLLIGVVNAILVVRLKVESFIATLGTGTILTGLAVFVAPTPVGKAAPSLSAFYQQRVGGLYVVVLVIALLWIATWFVLRRTVPGRHVFAVGADSHVAEMSGIAVTKIQVSGFLASGLLGGLAGLFVLASAGLGDANAAAGLEFTALATVVIGGASLDGGRGKLLGLLGGVVLFALIGNIFNMLRIDVWYQELLRGLVILVAAAMFAGGARTIVRRRPRAARPA
ncbi:ABC transporter permease [Cellulomonas fengjieae]|uniref:ABC transporter permease n=1 Tax=Cellulomonas fengjieae TaxID=2819978 RepID=A0ABS3SGG1_9CELL|nr:ABC transporter permease [Cellulomonas fengjieae]MBO3084737.1 ABC transporter permease [Cellulomonas fengjieae]MBO3103709.1 ABC transporter permease [Cellulomonas fengjieae]QVI66941.1 ABC transporter permease [Cellulomonas fengjieae]